LWLPNPAAPLSWRLDLRFDQPVRPTVRLEAPDHEVVLPFAESALEHDLALLGVAPRRVYTVTIEADGQVWPLVGGLLTPPLPDRFPIVELLTADPDRMAPGVTLTDLKVPTSEVAYLAAFDAMGRVVWFWDVDADWGDTRALDDYRLLGLSRTSATIANLFGGVEAVWTEAPEAPHDIGVEWRAMHHEVHLLPDGGLLTLSESTVDVDDYPTTYTAPWVGEPATLDDPIVVELAPDGSTRRELRMSEILDTRRIGFDSLDLLGGSKRDWAHTNGLAIAPDGDWVISVRHQDAVVKVSPEGELRWILAPHAGWGEAWQEYLLEPVGPLTWPAHQHAPEVLEDGTIVVLDNGRWRASPYDGPQPEDHATYTRAVAYRVEGRTVEQLWEVVTPLYSAALGDADVQPGGTVLMHLGFLDADETGDHASLGWGRKALRLIEVHPDTPDAPVWDLRLRSDLAAESQGWKGYRGERLPSLYPPGVLRGE
jgi:arylsulfate sulfotransferase